MSYSPYLYAIGLGSDVPLVSLLNVQQMLYPHNRVSSQDARMQLGVVADTPDFAPIRLQSLDAQENRDGITYLAWDLTLTTSAVSFWLNYFWSGAVSSITGDISTPVTINTRLTEFNSYGRYNAYAIYPTRANRDNGSGDLRYSHQRGLWYLHQRFNDLIASS